MLICQWKACLVTCCRVFSSSKWIGLPYVQLLFTLYSLLYWVNLPLRKCVPYWKNTTGATSSKRWNDTTYSISLQSWNFMIIFFRINFMRRSILWHLCFFGGGCHQTETEVSKENIGQPKWHSIRINELASESLLLCAVIFFRLRKQGQSPGNEQRFFFKSSWSSGHFLRMYWRESW